MSTKVRLPGKRASKTGTDGYRHEKRCAHSGHTLAEVSLNAELCVCDPHGNKARALGIALEKSARRDVLQQDRFWYPKDGTQVRLDQMSLRWKKNVLTFLERRAPALHLGASWQMAVQAEQHVGGDWAQDSLDQIADEVMETQPITWLYQQALVMKLEELIREGHDGPVDRYDESKAVRS